MNAATQRTHLERGYHVHHLSGGQVRRYGPTIDEFVIIIANQHTLVSYQNVRSYCTSHVRKAHDPKEHDLLTHLMEFKLIAPRTYFYKCGHDYTG